MSDPVTTAVPLRPIFLIFLAFLSAVWLVTGPVSAAETGKSAAAAVSEETDVVEVAPVKIDGVTLLRVRGVSSFPAEKRATLIAGRIEALAADRRFSPSALRAEEAQGSSRILAGDQPVLVVIDADARLEGIDRPLLASVYVTRIGEAISSYRSDREPEQVVRASLLAMAGLAVLAVLLWLGARAMRWLDALLERRIKSRLEGLEAKSLRLLNATQLWHTLRGLRSLFWTATVLVAIVFYFNFVLQLFPWTRDFGVQMFALLFDPLRALGRGLLGAIPDLIILAIIVFAARYLLKAINLLFTGIASGSVALSGLSPELAMPTYRLVRLLVIAFTIVVAYPYIPGSESEAFKGVSLFLGVIFSLGSSSVIGNVIAGYTMIYRRAFHIGDRIRINEHLGDVVETRLLVTHLRTPKNEEIVIPNSVILNSSVVNYSLLAREGKLILHSSVGIGYETPWRQVEAMLVQAAERTEGLLTEPSPFVLQKALGDFAVTYEINAYCGDAQAMDRLYARLHQSILDVFNDYGVQIMTPAYEGDPAQPKVVPKEQWYAAPAVAPARERR
jgi:small-conductance mechanosensitive channel